MHFVLNMQLEDIPGNIFAEYEVEYLLNKLGKDDKKLHKHQLYWKHQRILEHELQETGLSLQLFKNKNFATFKASGKVFLYEKLEETHQMVPDIISPDDIVTFIVENKKYVSGRITVKNRQL